MNRQRVMALLRKDWAEILRNAQALFPIILVPLIFVIVLPSAVILLAGNPALGASVNGMDQFLDNLPASMFPPDYSEEQILVYAMIVYFFAPFFLIIPVMVASIIASSSFVGEKERRTLEGLLYTPLSNRELVLGKVLASFIPAVVLSWVAFVVYTVLVNALGSRLLGGLFFPTWTWGVMMAALVPLVAFLAICLIVAVSQRSKTMQGAQGVVMLLVLPIIALVVSQAVGLLLVDVGIVLVASAILLVVDVVVFGLIARSFDRERTLTRL